MFDSSAQKELRRLFIQPLLRQRPEAIPVWDYLETIFDCKNVTVDNYTVTKAFRVESQYYRKGDIVTVRIDHIAGLPKVDYSGPKDDRSRKCANWNDWIKLKDGHLSGPRRRD